ncbi:DNA breaking-rejoining protein [Alloprevotella tannerae]|uniref:DNA breaking-rejoining protein n=1 Tax=Alloprevotella tannerae TaxID=76122 RepID=A0A929RVX5_9BACT|nr:DNA breaking-rejoining protein [Alloprevotella tannerae]MBF0969534.1 DNA breaking-rejoining protein [Alloprevotella tannerae]
MKKYVLEKSKEREGWWVLTDTEYGAVIQFEERKYNETQRVTFLADCKMQAGDEMNFSRVLRKMGEWINRHHASICFEKKHVLEWSEDNEHCYLVRTVYPRLRLEILDECKGSLLRQKLQNMRRVIINNYVYKRGTDGCAILGDEYEDYFTEQ